MLKRGLKPYGLAKAAKISQGHMTNLMAGKRRFTDDTIDRVAGVLGLDPEPLKTLAESERLGEERAQAVARHTFAKQIASPADVMNVLSVGAVPPKPALAAMLSPKIPMPYFGKVGCGDPVELGGEPLDRVGVPESYLQEGDVSAMAVLVADGNSMNLAGIQHGMNLLVDTSLTAQPGDVVIATAPIVGTTCKRLARRADGLYLVPESTEQHIAIKVADDVRVNGVVLRAWVEVEFRRGK